MDRSGDLQRIAELEMIIADQKEQIAKLKSTVEEYKSKEQTISSAIIASMEHANQLEASRKKLYSLDIQRTRLMYLRMEQVINELYVKYPELRKDTKLKDMSEKFKSMVFNDIGEKSKDNIAFEVKPQPVADDPIKKLLHNIIDCFETKKVEAPKKPVVEPLQMVEPVSSSGFDLNEALHPTMELDEILKVFNLGKKEDEDSKK